MAEIREITSGLLYPEGPVAMDDGSIIVTELQTGRLVRVQPDGKKDVVAELGGSANGAAIGPDGMMYVCNGGGLKMVEVEGKLTPAEGLADDYTGGSIQRVDITSGAVETLYTECNGRQLRGPNDIVFDAAGGFWFTDFGKVQETRRLRSVGDRQRYPRPRSVRVTGCYRSKRPRGIVRYERRGPDQTSLVPPKSWIATSQGVLSTYRGTCEPLVFYVVTDACILVPQVSIRIIGFRVKSLPTLSSSITASHSASAKSTNCWPNVA